MLASDIITQVRSDLRDTVAVYRWSDATLLSMLSDGLQSLFALRADAFYIEDVVFDPPAAITALTNSVPVFERYKPALIAYVEARALSQDADDTANLARSSALYDQFRGML